MNWVKTKNNNEEYIESNVSLYMSRPKNVLNHEPNPMNPILALNSTSAQPQLNLHQPQLNFN